MLGLASIANCRAHYLISRIHTERYFKLSALLGRKDQLIMVYLRTNTFAHMWPPQAAIASGQRRKPPKRTLGGTEDEMKTF